MRARSAGTAFALTAPLMLLALALAGCSGRGSAAKSPTPAASTTAAAATAVATATTPPSATATATSTSEAGGPAAGTTFQVGSVSVVADRFRAEVTDPAGVNVRSAPQVTPADLTGSLAPGAIVEVEGRVLQGQEAEPGNGTLWYYVGTAGTTPQFIYGAPGTLTPLTAGTPVAIGSSTPAAAGSATATPAATASATPTP